MLRKKEVACAIGCCYESASFRISPHLESVPFHTKCDAQLFIASATVLCLDALRGDCGLRKKKEKRASHAGMAEA
jgi:hypothetical protein